MSCKKLALVMLFGLSAIGSHASAQITHIGPRPIGPGFGNYVTFDWTQYSTNTSYRAQGSKVSGSFGQATYDVTYNLDGRSQSAQITVRQQQFDSISFNFYNRRNGSTCPGTAERQGNVYYGYMSCRSGDHPVTIYL